MSAIRNNGCPRFVVVGPVQWAWYVPLADPPQPDGMVDGIGSFAAPGSGAIIAAHELRRRGADVELIATLGSDSWSRDVERFAVEDGIRVIPDRSLSCLPRSVVMLDLGLNERFVVAMDELNPPDRLPDGWAPASDQVAVVASAGARLLRKLERRCAALVVHARTVPGMLAGGVRVDVVSGSGRDPYERDLVTSAEHLADALVLTDAGGGGRYKVRGSRWRRWAPVPLDGFPLDSSGCGANFLGGLAYGLAETGSLARAIVVGAESGAACLTATGPFIPFSMPAVSTAAER